MMTQFTRTFLSGLVAAAVLPAVMAVPAGAEEEIVGSGEFLNSCAPCHGAGGRGDGPVAEFLNIEVPDLTALSERNDGAFPFQRAVQVIDGRVDVRAHGDRDMPVWGRRYAAEIGGPHQEWDSLATEQLVRGRILELVNYLQAIQQPANGEGPLLSASPEDEGGEMEEREMD